MQGRRFQFSPLLSYAHPTLPTRTGCRLARSALCVACSKLAVYQLDSKPAAQAPLPRGPQPRSRGLAGRCGATSAVLLQDQPGAAKGSHTAPRGYTSALVRGFEGAPGGRLGTLGAASSRRAPGPSAPCRGAAALSDDALQGRFCPGRPPSPQRQRNQVSRRPVTVARRSMAARRQHNQGVTATTATPAQRPAGGAFDSDAPAVTQRRARRLSPAPAAHVMRSAPAAVRPAPTIRSQAAGNPAGPTRPGPADDAAVVQAARSHT